MRQIKFFRGHKLADQCWFINIKYRFNQMKIFIMVAFSFVYKLTSPPWPIFRTISQPTKNALCSLKPYTQERTWSSSACINLLNISVTPWGSPRCVLTILLYCHIGVSEFELQLRYHVYVQINTLANSMNLLVLPPSTMEWIPLFLLLWVK